MPVLTRLFLCIGASMLLAACRREELPANLIGTWKAQSLVVADSVWSVDIMPITLELHADHQFNLYWYGGVTESGDYTWSDSWLGIQSSAAGRRKLRITYFDTDSLAVAGTLQDQRTEIGFRKSDGE